MREFGQQNSAEEQLIQQQDGLTCRAIKEFAADPLKLLMNTYINYFVYKFCFFKNIKHTVFGFFVCSGQDQSMHYAASENN